MQTTLNPNPLVELVRNALSDLCNDNVEAYISEADIEKWLKGQIVQDVLDKAVDAVKEVVRKETLKEAGKYLVDHSDIINSEQRAVRVSVIAQMLLKGGLPDANL